MTMLTLPAYVFHKRMRVGPRNAFACQQSRLTFPPPAVSRQAAVLLYHAMAGNDERHWVGSACVGHGAHGFRLADSLGNLRIAAGLSAGNPAQGCPHELLKGRSPDVQGDDVQRDTRRAE